MVTPTNPPEISHRTQKLLVGFIAIFLGPLTDYFASRGSEEAITSISAAYWRVGMPSTIFVGCLFAIAAFLLAYNGYSSLQKLWSKVAGVGCICIALFPTKCDVDRCIAPPEWMPYVHYLAAAIMFLTLAYFSFGFRKRALKKVEKPEPKRRAYVYLSCGILIILATGAMVVRLFFKSYFDDQYPRWIFYSELLALVAFGVSWLTASHWVPLLASDEELQWPKTSISS